MRTLRYSSTELLNCSHGDRPAPAVVDSLSEFGILRLCETKRRVRHYRGTRSGRRRFRPKLAPIENGAFIYTDFNSDRLPSSTARRPPSILPVRTLRHTEAVGSTISFGLLNIRSMNNKLYDLQEVCQNNSLKVIGLCETWHDENSAWIGQLLLDGYQVAERARPRTLDDSDCLTTNHGGVAICAVPGIRLTTLKSSRKFQTFELVSARVSSVESCVLALVYRPGSTAITQLFFTEMSELLEDLASLTRPVYVAGDLNVRLDREDDAASRQLCELFTSYNFAFQRTEATHVKGGLLDVVVYRNDIVPPQVSLVDVGLSDHHLVRWTVPLTKPCPVYASITRRAWRKLDTLTLRQELATSRLCQPALWSTLDIEELALLYDQEITDIVERPVPVTTVSCRRRPSDPWFDDECRRAKRELRSAERNTRIAYLDPAVTAAAATHWTELRRAYRQLLRHKREAFWNGKVDSERTDPRCLWRSLNTLLGRGRTQAHGTPTADAFAEYLRDKDAGLCAATDGHFAPVPSVPLTQCYFGSFQPLSTDEVVAHIRALPDKQCANDPLPTVLLKEFSDLLAPFITALFNRSISAGIVPSAFKSAYITPRLKKSNLDSADVKSYRPISNLTVLSKLLERLVSHQLIRYLTTSNLLPDLQSAYRTYHSTETAVLKVTSDILRALDRGDVAVIVLLDLTAAFDTVDHGTLLRKMEASFGVGGSVLQWFTSYLSNRTQHVRCANSATPLTQVLRGVPQGSVLGPILFVLYIADIVSIVQRFGLHAHLYADDTQVYGSCSPATTELLQQRITLCLTELSKWLKSHRLQLNAAKTEVIWLAAERQTHLIPSTCLRIDGIDVQPVSSVRNLGIFLDSTVSMKTHVSKTVAGCFNALRLIRSIRRSVSATALKTLVSTLVLTKLDYGNATLAGVRKYLLNRLQSVLNAAARMICRIPPGEHVTPSLRDLHWLSAPERIHFKLALLTYRCLNGVGPAYLANELVRVADLEGRQRLRSARSTALVVPRTRLRTVGDRAFPVAASRAWNCLPPSVKLSPSLNTFKEKLKTWLFRTSYL